MRRITDLAPWTLASLGSPVPAELPEGFLSDFFVASSVN